MHNPFKWHIVQNADGQYAVRRYGWMWFSYEYHDFAFPTFAWPSRSKFYTSCITSSLESAKHALNIRTKVLDKQWTPLKNAAAKAEEVGCDADSM